MAELSWAWDVRSADSAFLDGLLGAGGGFEELRRAVIGLPGVLHEGLVEHHVGLLQVDIDGEQWRAGLDLVALAGAQGLDAADFVGADEDEVGLDPALVAWRRRIGAAGQPGDQRHHEAEREGTRRRRHGTFPVAKIRSRCARISAATSSGAKRSNSPLQTTAIRPGAMTS